jgi:hypothetical protein
MIHARTLAAAAAFVSIVCVTSTPAQVASALIREGGPVPGGIAGHTISAINNTAVNQVGGYAATVNSTDGVTTISQAWGHATGGPGTVLFMEGTFGPLVQTSWESFFGIDDAGQVSYSTTGTGGPVGSFDSVWVNATPIAVEGNPASVAGMFWVFASRPGITRNGMPYFVGGFSSTMGGATQNRGLFFGPAATPVLLGGSAVPGLPFALVTSGFSFDYRYSALGSHFITDVTMVSGSTTNDVAMVMDGSGLMIGGFLVREGSPVPAVAGGMGGENWANFDLQGINEAGDYMFTGDTSGPTTTDEFVLKNGVIVLREGDLVDSDPLTGDIEGAFMNETGDVAVVWDLDIGGTALEALIVNGIPVLVEGDAVDLDGDGMVEPMSKLSDFTGISALTLGPTLTAYFTADVDVNGTPSTTDDIEGFFCMALGPGLAVYCTAKVNSCGTLPMIGSMGVPSATAASGFTVHCQNARGSDPFNLKNGVLIYSVSGPGNTPFLGGTLCLDPAFPIKRTITLPPAAMGTPNMCDAMHMIDMNAFTQNMIPGQGMPDPALLMAAQQVWCQWVARDTLTNGSLVSDALTYVQFP